MQEWLILSQASGVMTMKSDQKASHPNAISVPPHRQLFNPVASGIPSEFPFRTVCTLLPLLDHWRRMVDEDPDTYGAGRETIEARLKKTPALKKPIKDLTLLRDHHETVELLLRTMFLRQEWAEKWYALVEPYGTYFLYGTPPLEEMLLANRDEHLFRRLDVSTLYPRILYAYKDILHKYYDFELQLDQPVILVIPDAGSDMDRYFKLSASSQYTSVENRKPVPKLSPAELDLLLHNIDDMALWMKHIPPDCFEFTGFSLVNLIDVTNELANATLKHMLLAEENVIEKDFGLVQREVRTLFKKSHLQLGLASIQKNGELNFHSKRKIWNSLRIRDAVREGTLKLGNTFYDRVLREGRVVAIEDIHKWSAEPEVKALLLKLGVRSILLAPLRYKGRMVGLLELSSSRPGDLNALTALKLKQVESIFALVVHQNLEQFETRVESIIQKTYTAIHPTVAWRFREAAISMIEQQKAQGVYQPEAIVFQDLYPLYGSADVRGSSRHQNEALQADMIEHLELVRKALAEARAAVSLTLIDEFSRRVGDRIEQLRQSWSTGDDTELTDFITNEINPLLNGLKQKHPSLAPAIETYYAQVGNDGGLLSTRHRAYEAGLQSINNVISEVLEQAQPELQEIFPHYFEKYRTDGIEHMMYLGAGLAPDRTFDQAYVRNLRLRQLMLCCEIARQVHRLNRRIEIPLDITQLVLVQDAPLTIRFRLEEKKFDVDGAYSVRYEIVKKRIDKARLKDSDERVTQPDKIAIIYSLDKEAAEYLRYIEYLQASGELKEDIEQLALEDLPGVSGLRALRVEVNMNATVTKKKAEDIMKVVEQAG